ncbi:MAG: folylpolyglutamate synthase/dihydrofolate synthase family protein [Candidatus Omnitrophota bacterium]
MNYQETIDYINSFINFEKIPEYAYESSFILDRMYSFLEELGNPHKDLKTIHVAGSKGKGSTCMMIASILKEAGFRVGLYTSPHLIDTRERIRVLIPGHRTQDTGHRFRGFVGNIGEKEFIKIVEKIKPACERFRDHVKLGKLSFFEALTGIAFLYFKEREVDYAVLETGLGGRLDATNVTDPLVSSITPISTEHTDKLGNSLCEIAKEKAGIIKNKRIVVSAAQKKDAMDVIRRVCRDRSSKLFEIGKDIKYFISRSGENGQIFSIKGPGYSYNDLKLSLLGKYQIENASLAIGTVKSIDKDDRIKEAAIKKALKNISWPGRMEIVRRDPLVILDGAQDVLSIGSTLSSIKDIFSYKKLFCVFGVSSDKDIAGISKLLDKESDNIILTRSMSERAKDPFSLKENFKAIEPVVTSNVKEALDLALKISDKPDLILVTGSLYVVGEAIIFFGKKTPNYEESRV